MRFKDREDAGRKLAAALRDYRGGGSVVYALPRGGVVLGMLVAKELGAPLDLVIPRKIGHPSSPEYAIAAVTETGAPVTNPAEVASVDPGWFKKEVETQRAEAARRREKYLKSRKAVDVAGKTAIVVDDGIATGLTMQAAIKELRARKPAKIVVAVPVAARDSVETLKKMVDEVVCLYSPPDYFGAIGNYYDSFDQVEDEEVVRMMSSIART